MTFKEFKERINNQYTDERGNWSRGTIDDYLHYIDTLVALEDAPEEEEEAVLDRMYAKYFSQE